MKVKLLKKIRKEFIIVHFRYSAYNYTAFYTKDYKHGFEIGEKSTSKKLIDFITAFCYTLEIGSSAYCKLKETRTVRENKKNHKYYLTIND